MAAPTTSAHCEPQAVVNGVFLYLGRKVMQGNQFLVRLRALAVPLPLDLDTKSPAERSILVLGRDAALTFTGLQLACLAVLWALKLTPGLGMVFPAAIGVLMFMRAQLLPRVFTRRQLGVIDTPIWNIRRSEEEAAASLASKQNATDAPKSAVPSAAEDTPTSQGQQPAGVLRRSEPRGPEPQTPVSP
jgi:hypothetical protein